MRLYPFARRSAFEGSFPVILGNLFPSLAAAPNPNDANQLPGRQGLVFRMFAGYLDSGWDRMRPPLSSMYHHSKH